MSATGPSRPRLTPSAQTGLERQLLIYSTMAGASLLTVLPTAAGVVYVDLNPDLARGYNSPYDLDLDGDGTPDATFAINQVSNASSGSRNSSRLLNLSLPAGNAAIGSVSSAPLNSNYLLSSLKTWLSGNRQLASFITSKTAYYPGTVDSGGPWLDATNKFIGIRFQIDPGGANTTHYGWIRMSVQPQVKKFSISDYAYEDTPDAPVTTGIWLEADDDGAPGAVFWVEATEVDPLLAGFSSKPKVTGIYLDPLKSGKPKKAAAGVLTVIAKGTAPASVRCEWKKPIRLYRTKDFKAAYAQGDLAEDFLTAHPLTALTITIRVQAKASPQSYDRELWHYRLQPPVIAAVTDLADLPVLTASLGQRLKINGDWFGKKAPKAWLEYVVGGKVKALPLKSIKPYFFADAARKPGASCMNPDDGDSQVVVQMPFAWPAGWQHGSHNLVIDNGVGLASFAFGTAP